MRVELKIRVRASIEKAYCIAETYPLFVKSFREKKILWNTEKGSRVRITNDFFAMPLTWEGESIKKKNEQINWVQTKGLLKGLRATWIFNSVNGVETEVIIESEFAANGARGIILKPWVPVLVKNTANKILTGLKLAAESK